MSSPFDALFSRYAKPKLFSVFGDASVAYLDASSGVSTTLTAIVGAEESELYEDPGSRARFRHRIVQLQSSDVPTPKLRADRVTLEGEDWTVWEVLGVQAGVGRVRVVRPERVESGGRRSVAGR